MLICDVSVQAAGAAGSRCSRRAMEAAAGMQEGQGEAPGLQRVRPRANDASSTLGEQIHNASASEAPLLVWRAVAYSRVGH